MNKEKERAALFRSRETYSSAVRQFEVFCAEYNEGGIFPPVGPLASELLFEYYGFIVNVKGNMFASVHSARFAIQDFYMDLHLKNPTTDPYCARRYTLLEKIVNEVNPPRHCKVIEEEYWVRIRLSCERVLSKIEFRSKMVCCLLYVTGLRSSSLVSLRRRHFRYVRGKGWEIYVTVIKGGKKPETVLVPLDPEGWENWAALILRFLNLFNFRDDEFVFKPNLARSLELDLGRNAQLAAGDCSELVRQECRAVGMVVEGDDEFTRVSARSARRARAQHHLKNGATREERQAVLMHSHPSSQDPYLAGMSAPPSEASWKRAARLVRIPGTRAPTQLTRM